MSSRLALALLVLACRPTGPEAAPPVAAAPREADAPREHPSNASPRRPIAPDLCAEPEASFAEYRWLPNEVFTLVTVRLGDDALATSLAALADRAPAIFADDPSQTFAARFAAELPSVRALLERAALRVDELAFLSAGERGVWAAPRLCEPDGFARVAAALGLQVRELQAPLAARIAAPASSSGHGLLQLASGGPLWIAPTAELEPLLAWLATLSGDPGEFYAGWLRDPRNGGTLRVLDTDHVPAGASDLTICLTTRRLVFHGSAVDKGTVHTMVYVTGRKPAP